uniref:Metalloendopeptidase n=1 Tax=Parastrongyloides trichosuri TaxID=131310 RepID=A0A0N4ZLZ2_PARTI
VSYLCRFYIKTFSYTKNIKNNLKNDEKTISKRGIYIGPWLWNTTITYFIEYSLVHQAKIREAFKELEEKTCLKFENVKNKKDAEIVFEKANECSSIIGRRYDKQTLVKLTDSCSRSKRTVKHEIGHAIGLDHEHQDTNRDDYITVKATLFKNSLDIRRSANFSNLRVRYDYGSVMHYGSGHYSKGGKDSIFVKHIEPFNKVIGRGSAYSFSDIKKINKLYCNLSCESGFGSNCANGGYHYNGKSCLHCICPKNFKEYTCRKIQFFKDKKICNETEQNATEKIKEIHEFGKKTCLFLIKASKGHRVRIKLSRVKTKDIGVCEEGQGLEIKYLKDKGITGLALCGFYHDIEIVSEGEEVYVEYNGLENDNLFSLEYKEVEDNFLYKYAEVKYKGKCISEDSTKIFHDKQKYGCYTLQTDFLNDSIQISNYGY